MRGWRAGARGWPPWAPSRCDSARRGLRSRPSPRAPPDCGTVAQPTVNARRGEGEELPVLRTDAGMAVERAQPHGHLGIAEWIAAEQRGAAIGAVSYTHLRAHETDSY